MKKNDGLTKEDLCWVLVKLTGAVLVYTAASGFYSAFVLQVKMNPRLGDSPLGLIFWQLLFPLVVGIRLLVSGKTLHGWLMSVPLVDFRVEVAKGEKPVGGDSLAERRLTPEEYGKYLKWVKNHPEISDEFDQLARFRDAQQSGKVK